MKGNKKSPRSVTLSLFVVMIALFIVCAQQRATVSGGDDVTADDEQFRQQILQLLELTEDTVPQQPLQEEPKITSSQDSDSNESLVPQDDVLSLLLEEEQLPATTALTSDQSQQTDDVVLSADMLAQVRQDISQLEKKLERRSMSIDSLRRLIENRDRRLRELESQPVAKSTTGTGAGGTRRAVAGKNINPAFMSAYQLGRGQFEQFKYAAAIETFQKLLADFPNHPMRDNCQYWIGESYFGLKQYQQAIIEFQKVFSFSEKNKHDDAQLMIALSYLRSGQKDKAQKEFETFLNNYTTSEYASLAKRYYRNI